MSSIDYLTTSATEIAHKLGIQKFDIYGSSVDETSVQVDQGEPKQVKASNRSSVTVRVWNQDQSMGITSTTDLDPLGIELALKTAQEASFLGSRNMFLTLALRRSPRLSAHQRKLCPKPRFPSL